jgi:type 1 glutamine amidotransferase
MPPLELLVVAALLSGVVALVSCAPETGAASAPALPADDGPAPPGAVRVLLLTGGEHHDFAGNAAALLQGLRQGAPDRWAFTALALGSQDPGADAARARLDALDLPAACDVVLAYTQGELGLSSAAREHLLAFVRSGGGFVGLHCAADSHPGWTEYDRMLGGRFEHHPPFGPITVHVDAPDHPVTRGLPAEWSLPDEFYHLTLVDDAMEVLMSGVSPEGGARRPVTWARAYGQGRVVYTILGHGRETHADARFQSLVAQALDWAAGGR